MSALIIAAFSPDIVEAAVWLLGAVDRTDILSHSIPAVLLISAVLGVLSFTLRPETHTAILISAVSVSHVLADYLTGLKQAWPGGPTIGLALYRYPSLDLALEIPLLVLGWLIYRRSLQETGRTFWSSSVALSGAIACQVAFVAFFLQR